MPFQKYPSLPQCIWREWRWTTGAQAHTMAGDTKTPVQPFPFPDEKSLRAPADEACVLLSDAS